MKQKLTIKQLSDGFYTLLPSYQRVIGLTKKDFSGQELSDGEKVDYYETRRMIFNATEYQIPEKERLRMLKKLFLTPTGSSYSQKIERRRVIRNLFLSREVITCLKKLNEIRMQQITCLENVANAL